MNEAEDSNKDIDPLAGTPVVSGQCHYVLTLYVTGSTLKSIRAITNLKRFCEKFLRGRYTLEIVDIYQRPDRAKSGHVVAAPTLVKSLPKPARTLIGDMSDPDRIRIGLGMESPT